MRYVKLVILALCVAAALLFFIQNDAQFTASLNLKFDLYIAKFVGMGIPLYALVLGAFLVGIFLSLIYFVSEKIAAARELRACNKKMRSLEQELNSLRNLPLSDQGYNTFGAENDLQSQPADNAG